MKRKREKKGGLIVPYTSDLVLLATPLEVLYLKFDESDKAIVDWGDWLDEEDVVADFSKLRSLDVKFEGFGLLSIT